MQAQDKLLSIFIAFGLFMAVSLMFTTVSSIQFNSPIISECGVNTEC